MGRKRVIIGGAAWGISANKVDDVAAQIKDAMETGMVVALELLDDADRQVTVYLNGKAAVTVVVDLGIGPKPTEISG